MTKINIEKIGSWSAIAGPLIFTFLIIAESSIKPIDSQISDQISYLGIGPFEFIQNANFIILGILIIIFGAGFGSNLMETARKAGTRVKQVLTLSGIAVIIAGAALLGIAIFPTAYWFYWLHTTFSFIAFFLALIASQLITWNALKNSQQTTFKEYTLFSLITGLISIILLVIFMFTLTSSFSGLTERLFAAIPLTWIEVTGIKLNSLIKNR